MEKIQSIKLKIFKRLSSEYNFCFKEYLKLKIFIYKNITSVIIFRFDNVYYFINDFHMIYYNYNYKYNKYKRTIQDNKKIHLIKHNTAYPNQYIYSIAFY